MLIGILEDKSIFTCFASFSLRPLGVKIVNVFGLSDVDGVLKNAIINSTQNDIMVYCRREGNKVFPLIQECYIGGCEVFPASELIYLSYNIVTNALCKQKPFWKNAIRKEQRIINFWQEKISMSNVSVSHIHAISLVIYGASLPFAMHTNNFNLPILSRENFKVFEIATRYARDIKRRERK